MNRLKFSTAAAVVSAALVDVVWLVAPVQIYHWLAFGLFAGAMSDRAGLSGADGRKVSIFGACALTIAGMALAAEKRFLPTSPAAVATASAVCLAAACAWSAYAWRVHSLSQGTVLASEGNQ